MVEKDSIYYRSSAYLSRHSDLQPRMRSILLDWLMEVPLFDFIVRFLNDFLRIVFIPYINVYFFPISFVLFIL